MHILARTTLHVAALAASTFLFSGSAAAQATGNNNMHFKGRLVAEPCSLAPGSAQRELHFLSVPVKDMYSTGRSISRPITVHLQNCNIAEGWTNIKVTFMGTESLPLPGFLQLDGGGATGVAIGLETADHRSLPLHKATQVGKLVVGNNDLTFMAFLKGEPDALKDRKIGLGDTNATVTFAFSYD
ncbi:fimbrial protein [Achromobacter pestifer]|uniref:Putative fimbrial-like protein YfcP n=1 Tax=Achromobacter pestifer TaxID=1353889 RepID=A0A6S6YV04_9BURK|nr:fimbrial protein [Achromobacter pestifer]CAB3639948.1 putative fimbrial-like protein YfcP [Achromobacter pestifer]